MMSKTPIVVVQDVSADKLTHSICLLFDSIHPHSQIKHNANEMPLIGETNQEITEAEQDLKPSISFAS